MLRSFLLLRRTGPWLSPLASSPPARRTLFSQDFLGVATFNEHKANYLKQTSVADLEAARRQAVDLSSREEGLLLSDDVKRVLYTAKNLKDASEAAEVLRRYVARSDAANATALRMNRHLTAAFLSTCHALDVLEPALAVFADRGLVDRLQLHKSDGGLTAIAPGILLNYAHLLYNHGRFQEVLDVYQEHVLSPEVPTVAINVLTLSMAACLKLGTADAFEVASRFMGHAHDDQNLHWLGRAGSIYALLAARQGRPALGYEALAFVRNCNIKANLLVFLLADLGRLEDAVRQMEEAVREADEPSFKRTRAQFSSEAIKALTTAVEKGGDESVRKKVALLFNKLDSVAEVSRLSLDDMVLSVITNKTEKGNEAAAAAPSSRHQLNDRRPIDQRSLSKDTQRYMNAR